MREQDKKEKPQDSHRMSVFEHLDELRYRLISSLVVIALTAVVLLSI